MTWHSLSNWKIWISLLGTPLPVSMARQKQHIAQYICINRHPCAIIMFLSSTKDATHNDLKTHNTLQWQCWQFQFIIVLCVLVYVCALPSILYLYFECNMNAWNDSHTIMCLKITYRFGYVESFDFYWDLTCFHLKWHFR